MPEQMEEAGMGFLDMPGGAEPSMAQPEMSPRQIGMGQYQAVLEKVVSRFKGGMNRILKIINLIKVSMQILLVKLI